MTYPSLSAFGLIGQDKTGEAREAEPRTLADLNSKHQVLPDTFIYRYPQLVRDDERPFASLGTSAARVAIIGGGFAGLTAAYELKRAGLRPVIYDARPNPGGCAESRPFKAEGRTYYNEMGPMRVPDGAKLFWHYLHTLFPDDGNVKMQPFPNPGLVATQILYGDETPIVFKGSPPESSPWWKIKKQFGKFLDAAMTYRGGEPGEIPFGKVLTTLKAPNPDLEMVQTYWSHFLQKYQNRSFLSVLQEIMSAWPFNWGAEDFARFGTLGIGTGGFGPLFPVCFLEMMRIILWGFEVEFAPHKPMSEIAERLKGLALAAEDDPSGAQRYLQRTVRYVGVPTGSPSRVRVHSTDAAGTSYAEDYDYVIVAARLRSMQISMNLDSAVTPPEFEGTGPVFNRPDDTLLRTAIRTPNIMDSSKLFGLLRRKPWAVPGNSWPTFENENGDEEPVKCIQTDSLARQIYILDPYPEDAEAGVNVLISYNWGADSTRIQGILRYGEAQKSPPRGNADYTLKQAYAMGLSGSGGKHVAAALDTITPALAPEHLTSVVWQQEPMLFGAFKLDYPGDYLFVNKLVYQYQQNGRRVFLAGENCSFLGGWIEGAMMSGVNAASAVLLALTEGGSGFRMRPLFEKNPFQGVQQKLEEAYLTRGLSSSD